MTTTPTQQLSDAGVSIWLDDLSRNRLQTGTLQKLIEEKNVVGVTTNPSIFHAAITTGTDYDATIAKEAAAGASIEDTIFEITTTDVADACDLFAPVAAATNGVDGRVSIEVDPASPGTPQEPWPRPSTCTRRSTRTTSTSRSRLPWRASRPSPPPWPRASA